MAKKWALRRICSLMPLAFDPAWLENVQYAAITAGASAPEHLVQGLIQAIESQAEVNITPLVTAKEDTHFKLPKEVREAAA